MTDGEYGHYMTDDELVALAAERSGRWPTPLPTIDVTDAEALRASAMRGARSLLLRGGIADGQLSAGLAEVADMSHANAALVVYIGDGRAAPLDGFHRAAVRVGPGWLLDEVGRTAIHRFARLADDDALRAYVAAFVRTVHERGVPQQYGTHASLWVAAASAEGAEALMVDGGKAATARMGRDGAVTIGETITDPAAGVGMLLDLVRRAAR